MKKYVKCSSNNSVFENWAEAYELIEKVIMTHLPDGSDTVEKNVKTLNSVFQGDPSWDRAYTLFSHRNDEEDLYEAY